MNDSTRHALDRIESALNRSARKRRLGFSTSPIVLALGLILAYQLLVRLVPSLWSQILPGGFEQGARLSGPSWLVWRMAWFCHQRFPIVLAGAVAMVVLGLVLVRKPATRPVVWLLGVASIIADGAILVIALKTGMDAVGVGQVFG
jgi:type II secretory pathway component PulF